VLKASTIGEIDAAFTTLASDRPDALFVGPDAFWVLQPLCGRGDAKRRGDLLVPPKFTSIAQ
jgi:hypothetical protein